ncbi:MAG: hypothetical protein MUD12_12930 [Spirochaetes bacterium]|jgi:hypothetical protein|nr:hypothetical protein [Spirochaetota bacterium]
MASITPAHPVESISGSIGGLVFYRRHGRTYARRRVVPANPDTEPQRAVRRAFGDAVRSWQTLDDGDREKWRRRAAKLRASGYNLFISLYMGRNITARSATDTMQRENTGHSSFIMKVCPSVSAPFQLKCRWHPPVFYGKTRSEAG